MGTGYESRVAAWAAALMLAEQGAVPPWELPAGVSFELVRCQTQHQVDDVSIGSSAGGRMFVQAKHGLDWSTNPMSELAKALDQFVRQHLTCRCDGPGGPLDRTRDRLLLAVDPTSSGTVRHRLPAVLKRLRDLGVQQTLADLVLTRSDQDLLSGLREHVRRTWVDATGQQPTESDERKTLELIWVGEVDVDDDGREAREARQLLRSFVLAEPTRDEEVWQLVKAWFKERAEIRSGADREVLRGELARLGIPLKAPPSYEDDIARLRVYSRETLAAVADFAVLHVGPDVTVKINRRCSGAILGAIETGSALVVGEPGAGKSGAVHDVVDELLRAGRDVLFLAVGRVDAQTVPALRGELHLDHGLVDVLAHWPGAESGLLVVDALDAARSGQAPQMLRELIARVPSAAPRWRVLASIRKFDLRHSQRLQQQFRGTPTAEFEDAEFARVHHVNVPPLDADELEQIGQQSSELAGVASLSGPIHELLTNPFNLRLIADLLGQGVSIEELTPIRTRIELLERYWTERVADGSERAYAREFLLTRLVEIMVRGRVLRADWRSAADASASGALTDLLTAHVLIEWQPEPTSAPDRFVLTFAHHVLFDYAVQLLLLRDPTSVAERLTNDQELVVSVRPSLVLRFEHAWEADPSRRSFWALVVTLMQAQIPEIGKLAGPEVATRAARVLPDFDPAFVMLHGEDKTTQRAAAMAITHAIGALLARPNIPADLVSGGDLWCAFIGRASQESAQPIPGAVAVFLNAACEQPEVLSPGQLELLGAAARRLLSWAWSVENSNQELPIAGINAVCRTFASDPTASREILRRALESSHMVAYGHHELMWLAGEVPRLVIADPNLVEEIYTAAFGYEHLSDSETSIGGQLLGLRSTEREDYGMGCYRLADAFPEFLEHSPLAATRSLIFALDTYVASHHLPPSGRLVEASFVIEGRTAHVRADFSATWDQGAVRHDDAMVLLDAFTRYLKGVASDPARVAERLGILDLIIERNHDALLWRRLLVVAHDVPQSLGRDLLPLLSAEPILLGLDTSTAAGDCINTLLPHLSAAERERLEQSILALAEHGPDTEQELRILIRDRLLGCLEPSLLTTDAARTRLEELSRQGGPPANTPPVSFQSTVEPYGEREYLADQGVAVDRPANQQMQRLEEPVATFAGNHLNSAPTEAQIVEVLPAIQALYSAVENAETDGVDRWQAEYAWRCVAEAAERIAQPADVSCRSDAGHVARQVLLRASEHPDPRRDEEGFDEHPAWGRAARTSAARGLLFLARLDGCADMQVREALVRLSRDPVGAVRYQIAGDLHFLYRALPDLMWELSEQFARGDSSSAVLRALVQGTLSQLAGGFVDRAVDLAIRILDRSPDMVRGTQSVRHACLLLLTHVYLWHDQQPSRNVVTSLIEAPAERAGDLGAIVVRLSDLLTVGPVEESDPRADAARRRAFDLLQRVAIAANGELLPIAKAHEGPPATPLTDEEGAAARALAQLLDSIAAELYSASGAFAEGHPQQSDRRERSLTDAEKLRFFSEARPLLEKLGSVGLPRVAHRLLETLAALIVAEPGAVFLTVAQVVKSASNSTLPYDPLAATLVVTLVARYLAEYPGLLRSDEAYRTAVLEVLDTFVRTGWPAARRLVYDLQEMYR